MGRRRLRRRVGFLGRIGRVFGVIDRLHCIAFDGVIGLGMELRF